MNEVTYLESVIIPLLDNVEALKIERTTDEMGVLLYITCAKADMGKLIGREGNNARAIRTLVSAYGMKNKVKVAIKILEPEQ